MHQMEKTNKILTIIGLCTEGLSVVVVSLFAYFFYVLERIPFFSLIEDEVSADELTDILSLYKIIGGFLSIMAIVLTIFLIINLFLFVGLMRSKWTEKTAQTIYLYQAIWGGLNLLSNQIAGVVYLVSGVQGYKGYKEMTDIREGI